MLKKIELLIVIFLLSFLFSPFTKASQNQEYVPGEVLVKFRAKEGLLRTFEKENVKGVSTDNQKVKLETNEPSGVLSDYASKYGIKSVQSLVPVDPNLPLDQFALEVADVDNNSAKQGNTNYVTPNDIENIAVVNFDTVFDPKQVADDIKDNPDIEIAEPNYIAYSTAVSEPNDPLFVQQWYLKNTGQNGGVAGEDINILKAWEINQSANNVKICYPDTSPRVMEYDTTLVDYVNDFNKPYKGFGSSYDFTNAKFVVRINSAEFKSYVPYSALTDLLNGTDDDGDGYKDNVYGMDFRYSDVGIVDIKGNSSHGGEGIALIAAVKNNNAGMTGVVATDNVEPITICSELYGCSYSAMVKAYDYAIKRGCKIVNASFGGSQLSEIEFQAASRLRENGILLVTSAGNDNNNNDANPTYPNSHNLDNIISVGATNNKGLLADFSNYGSVAVDIASPGQDLPVDFTTYPNSSLRVSNISGTSFAAPLTTGVAALVWEKYPNFDYKKVKRAILEGARVNPKLNGKIAGNRSLDAYGALVKAQEISTGSGSVDVYDINTDKKTDILDIIALIKRVFSNNNEGFNYDVTKDNKVDILDVVALIQNIFK